MRTLFTALCVFSLLGCGGPDESLTLSTSTTEQAVQATKETKATGEPMHELASPDLTWEAVWAHIGLDAKLRVQAMEERAFYTVELGAMTPEVPAPACPACR